MHLEVRDGRARLHISGRGESYEAVFGLQGPALHQERREMGCLLKESSVHAAGIECVGGCYHGTTCPIALLRLVVSTFSKVRYLLRFVCVSPVAGRIGK